MAVLRFLNENGVWVEIPALVGRKGDPYVLTEEDKQTIALAVKNSLKTQTWKFTLSDGTIIQKEVYSFD